jgi:hypothetical protein
MRQSTKIAKPSKDFPLTPHPSGRWCRRAKGIAHYVDRIEKPQSALDEWLRVKDHLLAGHTLPVEPKCGRSSHTTTAGVLLAVHANHTL